jgi:hypothetical protein
MNAKCFILKILYLVYLMMLSQLHRLYGTSWEMTVTKTGKDKEGGGLC